MVKTPEEERYDVFVSLLIKEEEEEEKETDAEARARCEYLCDQYGMGPNGEYPDFQN
jgi:hypothetical protein